MTEIHPQYITDTSGSKLVVLPEDEFDNLIEEIEELEDIRAYEEAKAEDDGYRISFEEYIAKLNAT
jgi:PHD/YefM family antitoxin component YafN of YafNO toxin-antitoxin module